MEEDTKQGAAGAQAEVRAEPEKAVDATPVEKPSKPKPDAQGRMRFIDWAAEKGHIPQYMTGLGLTVLDRRTGNVLAQRKAPKGMSVKHSIQANGSLKPVASVVHKGHHFEVIRTQFFVPLGGESKKTRIVSDDDLVTEAAYQEAVTRVEKITICENHADAERVKGKS